MAALEIVTIGDPVLETKAEQVPKITKRTLKLIDDMLETMYAAGGVGLAAPQVGVSERVIVLDVGDGPLVLVNPLLKEAEGGEIDVEGCLSIPERLAYVKRFQKVTVEGWNEKSRTVRIAADGLLARALQHEIDHLDGILILDRMLGEVEPDQVQTRGENQEVGE